MNSLTTRRRRLIVPEVVQTSALDCGPAALAALAQGFRIPASYPALRELCQTDIDGTSIDALEDVAQKLGLDATQQLIPKDFLLDGAEPGWPCIAVTRLPTGFVHFVVIWRRVAGRFLVMDPARGRLWVPERELQARLYQHSMTVPQDQWLEWASSPDFRDHLRHRAAQLGIPTQLVQASTDSWQDIANLDTALRMLGHIHQCGRLRASEAQSIFRMARHSPELLPNRFKTVHAHPGRSDRLIVSGALVVTVPSATAEPSKGTLKRVLNGKKRSPALRLLVESWKTPGLIVLATIAGAAVTVGEALIARFLVMPATIAQDRLLIVGILAALTVFLLTNLLLQFRSAEAQLALGRRFEAGLRIRLLERLPRLKVGFLASRLSGDLTERAHHVQRVRQMPGAAHAIFRSFAEILLITAGLLWLFPTGWIAIIGLALSAVLIPIFFQRALLDQDLKVRTHNGSLSRFLLSTLVGLETVRAHTGEKTLRQEHESILTDWGQASYRFLRLGLAAESVQTLIAGTLALGIIASYAGYAGAQGGLLLLSYWVLKLPVLGHGLGRFLLKWPTLQNAVTRIAEPLEAPIRPVPDAVNRKLNRAEETVGLGIRLQDIRVSTGGRVRLAVSALTIAPGERIAIVGSSGAGKSTLLRLLLGLEETDRGGSIWLDDERLSDANVFRFRQQMVWLDPAVRLLNGSFLENLRFGNESAGLEQADQSLRASELGTLIGERGGLSASVGEAGCTLSGGEGQRLRFARAFARPAGLVLMDEAFRGLGREQRRRLYERCLARWSGATLINITHDIFAAHQNFDRVLVLKRGQIVQDGHPHRLLKDGAGTYAQLYRFEQDRASALWGDDEWIRRRVTADVSEREVESGRNRQPNLV